VGALVFLYGLPGTLDDGAVWWGWLGSAPFLTPYVVIALGIAVMGASAFVVSAPHRLGLRTRRGVERLARDARYRQSLICRQCWHWFEAVVKATGRGYVPEEDTGLRCPRCGGFREGFYSLGFRHLNEEATKRQKYGGPADEVVHERKAITDLLEDYAREYDVDLATSEKVGRGVIYGADEQVVYLDPTAAEVGANSRAFTEHYLLTGEKAEPPLDDGENPGRAFQ